MNSKLSLTLRMTIMLFVSSAFVMYLMATATDHWQATKYKVHVHWIAVSAGDKHEDNALIEDLYRYTSSHSGLWRGCGTVNGKKLCAVLKIDQAWIRSVRGFMALALVSILVVVVFVIATFFRRDLVFKFPGVMSLITAFFGLLALAVYSGKSGVPEDNYDHKSEFGWSFIIGWAGWALNVAAALLCFLVPDEFEKIAIAKV